MRERDVERALVKAVKEAGGLVRKLRWIGRRGAPDRLVTVRKHMVLVELKAPGGRLSRLQVVEHKRLREAGFEVMVVWKPEQIVDVIAPRLQADGFEDALIGVGFQFNRELSVYDYDKCVEILMERDGMSEEDAVEFMNFNVTGAWVGESTPIFMSRLVEE